MDLNNAELAENHSDSTEDQLEEEDDFPLDFKSTAQIRFESHLLKRFAKACLLISLVLFIGQIVVASTSYHYSPCDQQSSILTGFCLSILLFLTWGSIMAMFDNSLPQKIKASLKDVLIGGCSNASICGMVINIKPMEANDQLENGDIIQEHLDTSTERKISTSEISFELLLHRLGNCCLILSAILFLGQIITVSIVWEPSLSSVINGFGFSILLFMSWGCIHSVYAKGTTNERLKWCQQQISFRFRIQNIDEMKMKIPHAWLTSFSIIYFIVGFSIAACQSIILYQGDQSQRWFSTDVIAVRFGYSGVLICTGITSICLIFSSKKRTSNFFCFIFAVASLVLASIGSSDMWSYYSKGDFEIRNEDEFRNHLSRLDQNSEGKPYFLGWWTVETLVFQCFQLLIIAISAGLICICINLWFHIRIVPKSEEQSEESQRNYKYMFSVIGIVLMISGFVINICSLFEQNILVFGNDFIAFGYEYFTLPFACLSLYLGGLLSLSVASSYRVTRRGILFLFSFVIMASTIYCLYQFVCYYHYQHSRTLNIGEYIYQNSEKMCLDWAGPDETCISIEKRCDGVLDFINSTVNYSHGPKFHMMLIDELYCSTDRYISVYISIFGAAGVAIILTVALWVMTFDTLTIFGKMLAATFKKQFFSHVPLVSS